MIQIQAILEVKLYMFSHLCGLGLLPIIPHTKDAGPVGSRSNNNNNNNNFIGTQPKIKLNEQELLKVYMTDLFFICSIKSLQCTDKYSKKGFFHSDFPVPCFDVPKASNFTSRGVQNRETKNRGLGTIVTSIQDSKPRERQISPMFSYFLINNALLFPSLAN